MIKKRKINLSNKNNICENNNSVGNVSWKKTGNQ